MGVRRNTHIHVEFLYRLICRRPSGRALSTFVDLVRIAFFALCRRILRRC